MTSELKPCPFCGYAAELKEYHRGAFEVECSREDCAVQPNTVLTDKETAVADWNTRAVPDVPELVRYGNYIDNRMHVKPTGEYVRYDQAAAIIAAKEAEIERLNSATTHRMD